jgi:hypothetical protein
MPSRRSTRQSRRGRTAAEAPGKGSVGRPLVEACATEVQILHLSSPRSCISLPLSLLLQDKGGCPPTRVCGDSGGNAPRVGLRIGSPARASGDGTSCGRPRRGGSRRATPSAGSRAAADFGKGARRQHLGKARACDGSQRAVPSRGGGSRAPADPVGEFLLRRPVDEILQWCLLGAATRTTPGVVLLQAGALANDEPRERRATLSIVVVHAAKPMENYELTSPYIALPRH